MAGVSDGETISEVELKHLSRSARSLIPDTIVEKDVIK